MKYFIRGIIFIFFSTLFYACGLVAEKPFYLEKQLVKKDELLGRWKLYGRKDKKSAFVTIRKNADYYDVFLDPDQDKKEYLIKLHLFKLDKNEALLGNMYVLEKGNSETPIHALIKIEFKNKKKAIVYMTEAKVFQDDSLQVPHEKGIGTITLKGTSRENNDFIRSKIHLSNLFEEYFEMERQKK